MFNIAHCNTMAIHVHTKVLPDSTVSYIIIVEFGLDWHISYICIKNDGI